LQAGAGGDGGLIDKPLVCGNKEWARFIWMIDMKHFNPLTPAFFCFVVAFAPNAQAQDANWEAAGEALEVCARIYPDTAAAWPLLGEMGWRNEGTDEGMRIFSRNGYRAVVAINAGTSRAPMCMVSASRMTPEYALSLATAIAPSMKDATRTDEGRSNLVARWQGTMKGQPTVLGVVKHVEFEVMRGAAVGFMQR
jgi:hypothetical protein